MLKRVVHALERALRRDRSRLEALTRRQRSLPAEAHSELARAIEQLWFTPHPLREMFDEEERQRCMHALLFGRLDNARSNYVPWLDAARALQGARVLEIGCGSGPSTLALLEQGADVVGADVNESHMQLGRIRCQLYGLDPAPMINLLHGGFEELAPRCFDWVIFFASLEHMYLDERISLLRRADELLKPGAMLAIVECPNRLWYRDEHTSLLPFFDWLPHEVAFRYTPYSSRSFVRALGRTGDAGSFDLFVREGRGASFHDLQLALGSNFGGYRVVSSLWGYQKRNSPLRWLRDHVTRAEQLRYHNLLASLAPQIDRAFFEPFLNVVLQKPA
jgi:cyclopropane fatty-acyl-phospholipid synthase-like methyltransferase